MLLLVTCYPNCGEVNVSDKQAILKQLIAMSRNLGQPEKDYVILSEGNTSARIDEESFWVKASGAEMRDIGQDGFIEVRFPPVLAMLEGGDLSDAEIKCRLTEAKVDPDAPTHPSVETVLHALALTMGGANYVGHTHPTAVNAVLCSQHAEAAIAGRLFPDEIVVCGPAPAYVSYTDPGIPLARRVRDVLAAFRRRYGGPPKVILMQNHGLVALGRNPEEVENITAMCVKAARILLGAYALGGPHFMSAQAVARIHTRPDEAYRRRKLGS